MVVLRPVVDTLTIYRERIGDKRRSVGVPGRADFWQAWRRVDGAGEVAGGLRAQRRAARTRPGPVRRGAGGRAGGRVRAGLVAHRGPGAGLRLPAGPGIGLLAGQQPDPGTRDPVRRGRLRRPGPAQPPYLLLAGRHRRRRTGPVVAARA